MSFGQTEILRILGVTDALGLHREGIVIPLYNSGTGGFRMRGAKLEITAPGDGADFEAWLAALPAALQAFPDFPKARRAT
ncbi:MAG TPA: hypothetical protein VF950_11450 [Planctomycetota bacterium]